jgi:hypothetical protein
MKYLLIVLMGLIGAGLGAGARFVQPSQSEEDVCAPVEVTTEMPPPSIDAPDLAGRDFVKMSNQFVVPLVTEDHVAALVVMSIAIEIEAGQSELVYAREPKLRDVFLQVMFDHASIGRFSGRFATTNNLSPLRSELRTVAQRILGETVSDVLITEIARQDS